jgi:Xaa-Pro aminopeptidase
VETRWQAGLSLKGFEVDQAARDTISSAGYGEFFLHRTGHNIGTRDHGDGANIDNFETQDRRQLLAGTCFSIEPGIYLPGEFGVRLEYNLYLHAGGRVEITGGIQEAIRLLV